MGGVKAAVSSADTEAGTLPLYPVVMENSGITSLFCSVLENISGVMCLPLAILTIVFKNEISLAVISALRQEYLKFKAAFILSQIAKTNQTNKPNCFSV